MIAIVCGGRDYTDAARVKKILDAAVDRLGLHTIIEGGAGRKDDDGHAIDGADLLAWQWAVDRDLSWIEVPVTKEEWSTKGKGAGPARNHMMLAILMRSKEDIAVIAFPSDGPGTAHMCKIAEAAKVRVIRA